jgi:hypothetical protein
MTLHQEAQRTVIDVTEGYCALCRVPLILHEDQALRPCGACSYRVEGLTLQMGSCEEHLVKHCQHWQLIWRAFAR